MGVGVAGGLLEREHELARLEDVLARAARGAGSAIAVEGPPGIGKSALLDAAAALARERGLGTLRARGGELERALSFGVARDLLARHVARASGALAARLRAGAGAVALPALGLGASEGAPPESEAVHYGLTWLVTDLAGEAPLALVVDDVHWADPESAGWLAHLARRVADLPVALLLAARPPDAQAEAEPVSALRELADVERLRPAPLERESVAALVRSLYAPEAADEFVSACHAAAGGNPFHTHALLDAAAGEEIAPTREGADALAALAPEAVRRWVSGALRRAGEDAAELARACAVLGENPERRHAAALARLGSAELDAAAERLAAQGLLPADGPLRFTHPIVLAAVRQTVPPRRRGALHRAAAVLFERDADHRRAAAHLLEVEPAADHQAVATLTVAAGQALAEGAIAHAARLTERALAEPPPDEQRATLLGGLGFARLWARVPGAAAAFLAAADATPDVAARLEFVQYAGWAGLLDAETPMQEVVRRAAELPRRGDDGGARLDGMLAVQARWLGVPEVPPSTEALVARAEPLSGDSASERELLAAAVLAAGVEAALPAPRLLAMARRAFRSPAETPPHAPVTAGFVAAAMGAGAEVLEAVESGIAEYRSRGNLAAMYGLVSLRLLTNWRLGRLREAEADVRGYWETCRQDRRWSWVWSSGLAAMLYVLAARGLVEEAQALVDEEGLPPSDGGSYAHDGVRGAAGYIALERGDVARAVELLGAYDRGLARRHMEYEAPAPATRPFLVEALVRSGDVEAGRALAEKDLRLARAVGAPGQVGFALRGLGLAIGGPEGRALVEEGLPLLERAGERERLARALLDAGRMVRLEGRPTDAREPLRRAMGVAEDCGADLVAQRALEELRATGARPRRRELSGPASLTPSELRVARLAARGRTNREIAQELFVSTKTVETHLGHVYGKLAIAGRAQLAAAMRRP